MAINLDKALTETRRTLDIATNTGNGMVAIKAEGLNEQNALALVSSATGVAAAFPGPAGIPLSIAAVQLSLLL